MTQPNYVHVECCCNQIGTWIAIPASYASKLPYVYRDSWSWYTYLDVKVMLQVPNSFLLSLKHVKR